MKPYDIEKQILSIEQCRSLEKLGYDLDNATHCWVYDDSTGYKFLCLSSDAMNYYSTTTVLTPTWNLQECIAEILKKHKGLFPNAIFENDRTIVELGGDFCVVCSEIAENPIDACFAMLKKIAQSNFEEFIIQDSCNE